MPVTYRIKKSESIEQAVRRIVRGTLEEALREAVDDRQAVDRRVHKVRVRLKMARAALKLVRDEVGQAAEDDDAMLGDIGRILARPRDLVVERQALRRLMAQASREEGRKRYGQALRQRLEHPDSTANAELALVQAARDLDRALSVCCRFEVRRDRRAVRMGLAATYRRGRRAYRRALRESDAACFHDWRKSVKRLGYQAQLLRRAVPALRRAWEPTLTELGEVLGDLHDLALARASVAQVCAAEPRGTADVEGQKLLALIDQQARQGRLRARKLGARVFGRRPIVWRQAVDQSWARWRRRR